MVRHIILLLAMLPAALYAGAESAEQIRANKSYISGTGYGQTLETARSAALQEIMGKISMTVKTDFLSSERETQTGDAVMNDATFESTIHTYSTATLNNVQQLVVKPEPDAEVLMWIPLAEVNRIFEGRRERAREMVRNADDALAAGQVDDALRYYYWALMLVRSLRYPNEATVTVEGEQRRMAAWLPAQIDRVMASVDIHPGRRIEDNVWEITATRDGHPVRSLGYTYFDGVDNTLAQMRDGRGLVELRPHAPMSSVQVKLEFEARGLAEMTDREVYNVMQNMPVARFAHAYVTLPLEESTTPQRPAASPRAVTPMAADTALLTDTRIAELQRRVVQPVMEAIRTASAATVRELFTAEGYDDFTRVLGYGRVTLMPDAELQYFGADDGGVICRGIPVSCRFQGRRTFTEQLTLSIDAQGRVDHVSMGIGKQLADDLVLKTESWPENSRKRLVNFIEDYRTAYALKDIEYLERVFHDDAVIIVGQRRARIDPSRNDGAWQDNRSVQLTRYTKQQFIRRLQGLFATKQYVNLHFSNSRVIKPRPDREIYSIEVKQDYYSSNYGDTGYLTLVIDLTDEKNPVIYVRTWQEEPDPDFGVISVYDF